jgi:uncharacterized protein
MKVRYNFEWDPAKAKANLRKHGVSFEMAITVFRDPRAVSLFDQDHDEHEDRWATVGAALQGKILLVVHTFLESEGDQEYTVRVISARRATKQEQQQYEANL